MPVGAPFFSELSSVYQSRQGAEESMEFTEFQSCDHGCEREYKIRKGKKQAGISSEKVERLEQCSFQIPISWIGRFIQLVKTQRKMEMTAMHRRIVPLVAECKTVDIRISPSMCHFGN